MDVNSTIHTHAQWKTKLRAAIIKQEQMDVRTLAKDDCCELGIWLHGEAKAKFRRLASHADCVRKHAAFHVEVAKVAEAVNAKKFTQAEEMLKTGSPYALISGELSVAFLHLSKDAGL